MHKALLISAAVSMAFSGAAAAGGMKFGASADQYIDSSAQISANDCHSLSVESARNACLSSADAGSSSAVGATSGSASGTAEGGYDMKRMPSGSNESKPGSSASAGAVGATGSMKSDTKAQGSTKSGAKSQGSFRSDGKKQGNPAGSNESKPDESAASGVGGSKR